MSTATSGRAREHRVRDHLMLAGWELVARSAGSRGPADLIVAHPEHGMALVQVGTGNKTIGPADRQRFVDLADLCSALPILASVHRGEISYWLVNREPASKWTRFEVAV